MLAESILLEFGNIQDTKTHWISWNFVCFQENISVHAFSYKIMQDFDELSVTNKVITMPTLLLRHNEPKLGLLGQFD